MSPASNKDELLAELKGHHLPATLVDAVSSKLRQLEYAEQKCSCWKSDFACNGGTSMARAAKSCPTCSWSCWNRSLVLAKRKLRLRASGISLLRALVPKPSARIPRAGRACLGLLLRVERVIPCTAEQAPSVATVSSRPRHSATTKANIWSWNRRSTLWWSHGARSGLATTAGRGA